MDSLLILGGTAWLGRELARQAVASGVSVTCLARGEPPARSPTGWSSSSPTAPSRTPTTRCATARGMPSSTCPGSPITCRTAVEALAARAAHWTYVSSGSVYADAGDAGGGRGRGARASPMTSGPASMEDYGAAKAGCEALVTAGIGAERSLLARVGLIGGPGDPSDRFGYWVSRFALAAAGDVLVPDEPSLMAQVVDVRDLAAFLLALRAGSRSSGPVNVVGEARPLPDVIDASARVAGFTGTHGAGDAGVARRA